jgi:hypothetical protein
MSLLISAVAFSLAVVSIVALMFWRGRKSAPVSEVPEHIWEELKVAIPEADYLYLRATKEYMGQAPGQLIARLGYIGAIHDPDDPAKVRIVVLELRLADVERVVSAVKDELPSDLRIMWLALAAVSTVASLVALVFYLLDKFS